MKNFVVVCEACNTINEGEYLNFCAICGGKAFRFEDPSLKETAEKLHETLDKIKPPTNNQAVGFLAQFASCAFKCDHCKLVVDPYHMLENKYYKCIGCDCPIFCVHWSNGKLAAKIAFEANKEIILYDKNKQFRYR